MPKKHYSQIDLCEDCQTLKNYAHKRLDRCQFGENKPTCGKCSVHCYKQAQRQKIIKVMKFAGPKMSKIMKGQAQQGGEGNSI
ncbi:MAG: nitrous oxide-stimulated promoter family protein [Desulfitobacteriaceae bacterium]